MFHDINITYLMKGYNYNYDCANNIMHTYTVIITIIEYICILM